MNQKQFQEAKNILIYVKSSITRYSDTCTQFFSNKNYLLFKSHLYLINQNNIIHSNISNQIFNYHIEKSFWLFK